MTLIKLGDNAATFSEYCETKIKNMEEFKDAAPQIQELVQIINFVKLISPAAVENIKIDFSLARGLEYYTGMVFEAKLTQSQSSISGGGRYDHLLETINPTAHMPLVGGSIGIERIFALLSQQQEAQPKESKDTQQHQCAPQEKQLDVMICAAPGSKLEERLKYYGQLLQAQIRVGCSFKESASLKSVKRDLEEANDSKCKLAVIVGENECKGDKVTVKDLDSGEQTEINKSELVDYCRVQLGKSVDIYKIYYLKDQLNKAIAANDMEAVKKISAMM